MDGRSRRQVQAAKTGTSSSIFERCVTHLNYQQVFFTDIMPKTATGKIQRRLVAEAMLKQPKAKI